MRKLEIKALDGKLLSAIIFQRESQSDKIVIVSSATGVKKEFYTGFAQFMVQQGFDAIIYDYRGIGGSASDIKSDGHHQMHQWGELDMAGVIDWGKQNYKEVHMICHSIGGQVFPLAHNHADISSAVFVACQNVYWGHWRGWNKYKVGLFWYVILPLLVKIYGYLPSWILGGGDHLPKGIALDWRTYGTSSTGILMDNEKRADAFQSVVTPIKFISIKDDLSLAPAASVKQLVKDYKRELSDYLNLDPYEYQLKSIGHFGYFREKIGMTGLWKKTLPFLN